MRLALKLYIGLVAASAILLLSYDLSVLASWPHSWSLGVTIALIVLSTLSDQIQFEVRRGWYTNASAVAHVATAFLLPPALAMGISAIGIIVRAARFPVPLSKTIFNLANISLAVGIAAHAATLFGGPDSVAPGGAWTGPRPARRCWSAACTASCRGVSLRW